MTGLRLLRMRHPNEEQERRREVKPMKTTTTARTLESQRKDDTELRGQSVESKLIRGRIQMSRRKQSNPKPVKVEEDAMQVTTESASDQTQTTAGDDQLSLSKDNSDYDEENDRLVIDTTGVMSPPPSLTPGCVVGETASQSTSSETAISALETSLMAHSDFHAIAASSTPADDRIETVFGESIADMTSEDVKSCPDSIGSNFSDKDNNSLCGSISNGDMSLNVSNVSFGELTFNDAAHLSDVSGSGSGNLKISLSKSRKKSDRILPKPGHNGEENFTCPICQEVFPSNHDFTCHIRSHNSPTNTSTINTCTICEKVLSSQSSLDRHMLVHSGERPFRCKVCSMAFTTNGNMHRHMRIHEKNFQSANGIVLPNGTVVKVRRKKKLSFDPSGAASSSSLLPDSSSGSQTLDLSLAILNRNGGMNVDKKRRIIVDPRSESGLPAKKIALGVDLPNHLTSQNRGFTVYKRKRGNLMASAGKTATALKKRIVTVDLSSTPMKCPECQQKFFSKLCLAKHLEEHERQYRTSLATHCTMCKMTLNNTKRFQEHIATAHASASTDSEERTAEPRKTAKNGAQNVALSDLVLMDFSCENFSLASKLFVEKQPRRQAPKDLPNYCNPCERVFLCKKSYDQHVLEHETNCPNVCETCGMGFLDSSQYQDHVLEHERSVVMSGFRRTAANPDDPINDQISKDEFMLVLGMKRVPQLGEARVETKQNSPEVEACDEIIKNDISFDANQNVVGVPLAEESRSSGPTMTKLLPSSSLLSVLPKLSGKPVNYAVGDSNDSRTTLSGIVVWPPGTLQDVLLPRVSVDGMIPSSQLSLVPVPVGAIEIDVPSRVGSPMLNGGERILPLLEDPADMIFKTEVVSDDGSLGRSNASPARGSLPFKCSECPYSSTDKSTLLRHERKHNGQRPFQCRICDFAFTTKANCERHIRKKHPMTEGQRLEDAIGYTRFALESSTDSNPGIVLETVCKFCGEDFKFYRALKHHLRSQTSCQYKPCQCKICNLRFSTKANCMRHLQKKHHLDLVGPVESYMLVSNELRTDESLACNGLALLANEAENYSKQALDDVPSSRSRHPVLATNLQRNLPTNVYQLLGNDAEDSDEPLDYSLKSKQAVDLSYETRRHPSAVATSWQGDEPMDLTVRGQTQPHHMSRESNGFGPRLSMIGSPTGLNLLAASALAISSGGADSPVKRGKALQGADKNEKASAVRKGLLSQICSADGRLSCPKCRLTFSTVPELCIHIHSHRIGESSPFRCRHCSMTFTTQVQLTQHSRAKHPQLTDVASSFISSPSKPLIFDKSISLLRELNNNSPQSINANLYNEPQDSKTSLLLDGDLASVPRIIESTDAKLLKSMFSVPNSRVATPVASLSAQLNDGTSDVDESYVSTVANAAAKSVFHNIPKFVVAREKAAKSESNTTSKKRKQNNELIPKLSSGVVKKKRNSYADSPHKLFCSYCSRAFPWISSLKRHLLTHTGQKPFRCKQCPVTFSTKSNRERHMIRKHGLDVHDPTTRQTMDRPFKCHLCVFSSFTTSGKLLRHYSTKHPNREIPETLLNCTDSPSHDEGSTHSRSGLGMELLSAEQLAELEDDEEDDDGPDDIGENSEDMTDNEAKEVEQLTNTLIQGMSHTPGPLPLPVVQAVDASVAQVLTQAARASNTSSLDSLSDKHVNPERDNYNVDKITECWKCKKTFDCRKTLLRHLKEHSIDLPFKCYLCDASFEDRLTSLIHKADRHPGDWATVQEKNKVSNLPEYSEFMEGVVKDTLDGKVTRKTHEGVELDIKPESDYAQRKVFCTLCPKRFWSLQDLRRHMRSHTGDRPFECNVCFTRFTLKHSMMRHRRKHMNDGSAGTGAETQCSASDDDSINMSAVTLDGASQLQILTSFSEDEQTVNPENSTAQVTSLVDRSGDSTQNDQFITSPNSQVFHLSGTVTASKPSASDNSDLLQSLLGIDDRSTIDRILESPNKAATMLGINKPKEDGSA